MTIERVKDVLRGRRGPAAALAGLALLTVLALVPGNPAAPRDAATGAPAAGFHVEFPASGAWFEPFLSAGHALAGAPDYRAAVASTLAWLVLACGLRAALARRSALAGAAGAGLAAVLFASYVLLLLLMRPPGWRLSVDTPDFLAADLQTHTFMSHDGLVSLEDNLRWHQAAGYDVVAVTDHDSAWDPAELDEAGAAAAGDGGARLGLLPGAEVREAGGGYLLGLGVVLEEEDIEAKGLRDPAKFAAFVHGAATEERPDGGATLALYWKLRAQDVERLAKAGVDGFEVSNFGHPAVPGEVRRALLEARGRGLPLTADTDWHGYGGFARTWTAVRAAGARRLGHEDRAELVLDALRTRRAGDIVPLTAGVLGRAGPLRTAFAPLAEALRYCRELSAWRVLSWWVWAALLYAALLALGRARLRPGRVLLAGAALSIGCGLLLCGAGLLAAWGSGETNGFYAAKVGGWAAGLGLALAVCAAVAFYQELRRREDSAEPAPAADSSGPAAS